MAEKRDVKCNGCGHTWSSGAKPENLRCKKCGSKESFSIPNDVPDSQDEPTGEGTPAPSSTETADGWNVGDRCRVECDDDVTYSGEITSFDDAEHANILFGDGEEALARIDELKRASEIIKITNRLKKRNTFLADSVRDQRDAEFLNAEISQRKYKGRLLTVTTVKHYVVSADGFWVTEFVIELKD